MAMDLLRRLARSPLPVTLTSPADVDKARLLRAARIVIALTPAPPDPLALGGTADAAQVVAITQKGYEELGRFSYPGDQHPAMRGWLSGWKARTTRRGESKRPL